MSRELCRSPFELLQSSRREHSVETRLNRLLGFLLLLSFFVFGAHAFSSGPWAAAKPRERKLANHYLLLVNTAIAFQMTEAKLRQFDKSPYDGIAIAFLHAYDTSAVPSVSTMNSEMKQWMTYTSKDIWPWTYINRMVGKNPVETNAHADTPEFRKIAGADLDDVQGARSAYLQMWRNSLATARDSNVPGVVCDLEFYNNYKSYDIGELARQSGKTPADVATSLQSLGTQMADIAAQEYPDAVLWFFWTGFTHAGYKTYSGVLYYPSPTYIAIGLLDEIARKKMHLKVLTGGEGSMGYCFDTLAAMQSAISKRASDTKPALDKYNGILEMAGTMTLWIDHASNNTCKTASAASIEDLEPYIELLMKSYRYDWIWASGDGGYLAFSPDSAPKFNSVIQKARAAAWPDSAPVGSK